jgi:hypothetical protein
VLKALSRRRAPPTSGLSRILERASADGGPGGAFDHRAVTDGEAPNSRGLAADRGLNVQGRIGAASWTFSGVTGTPSLQRPFERCARVSPRA